MTSWGARRSIKIASNTTPLAHHRTAYHATTQLGASSGWAPPARLASLLTLTAYSAGKGCFRSGATSENTRHGVSCPHQPGRKATTSVTLQGRRLPKHEMPRNTFHDSNKNLNPLPSLSDIRVSHLSPLILCSFFFFDTARRDIPRQFETYVRDSLIFRRHHPATPSYTHQTPARHSATTSDILPWRFS